MRSEPQREILAAATDDPAAAGSARRGLGAAMPRPPTKVDPAAVDVVSMLTAVQFGAYGAMFQDVRARFAAAHEAFVKSLEVNAGSLAAVDRTEASADT